MGFVKKKRREKKEPLDLDITSLLDILVILLVFLLKSYNASDLKLDVKKGITLAVSSTTQLGQTAVNIQISKEKEMWMDNKNIGTAQMNGDLITNLHSELLARKAIEITRLPASRYQDSKKKDEHRRINIVLDKDLTYKTMKMIMHTAATAGYSKFKFIVTGVER